jgi:DNA transformation protein and related proteins
MALRHDGFKDFVLDQLADLKGIRCRAMFGGYGLYHGTTFFGIIHQSRLYFKTDSTTAFRYRARGMQPFKPSSAQTLKHYYEVPVEVTESADDLTAWASQAARLSSEQLPVSSL